MAEEQVGADSIEAGLRAVFKRTGSVLGRIEKRHGTVSRVLLRDAPEDATPVLVAPSEKASDDERYQIQGEIARGGVGVIFKGRDKDLGRDVALKVLRTDFAKSSQVVERFVEEAQIGGQLQHPGVVPVYGLGIQPDGRPSFAMKLVKGRTLSALLQDRPDPARERRRFLGIFEQICQTMAYAHARGVIHRDLKPSNVMVGAFGEVQIVDWGFAKVLGHERKHDPEPDVSIIATVRTGEEGSQSMAGSVMGTPAYMPPEQAMGQVDDLDERADVFALGAILCEILTGHPPYLGDPKDLLMMAAQGRLEDAHARLDECGDDPALARWCLAPMRGDRPRDAGVVAERIGAHLAAAEDRARQAELDAAEARAAEEEEHATLAAEQLKAKQEEARVTEERNKAEQERARQKEEARRAQAERKARGRTLALAAVLLLAVLIGGGAYAWLETDKAARAKETAADVARYLGQASEHEGAGRWTEAVEAARSAVALQDTERARNILARLEQKQREAEAAAQQEKADADFVSRLEAIALSAFADVRANEYRLDPEYAKAFRDFGIDVEKLAPAETAHKIRATTQPVAIASMLDTWAQLRRTSPRLEGRDWKRILAAAKTADPDPLRNRWRDALASGDRDELRRLAREVRLEETPVRTLTLVGVTVGRAGDAEFAVDFLRRVRRLHPADPFVNTSLARFLQRLGSPEFMEAARCYSAALAARPQGTVLRVALGDCLLSAGGVDEALALSRDLLQRAPNLAVAHNLHGTVLQLRNDMAGAIRAYDGAIRLDPDHWVYVVNRSKPMLDTPNEALAFLDRALEGKRPPSFAPAIHEARGDVFTTARRYAEAVEAYRASLRTGAEKYFDHKWLADVHYAIGFAQYQMRAFDDAIASYERAREYRPGWADAHRGIGTALNAQGKAATGIAALHRAARLDPNTIQNHTYLHLALAGIGDFEAAARAAGDALRLAPGDPNVLTHHAVAQMNLGEFQRALDIARQRMPVENRWLVFGQACFHLGDLDEALRACRQWVGNTPEDAGAHMYLGAVLLNKGRFAQARASLRKSLEILAPDDALGGVWQRFANRTAQDCERLAAVASRLTDILAGGVQPAGVEQTVTFGQLCFYTGHHKKAVEFFRAAFAAAPGSDRGRYEAVCAAMAAGARAQSIAWLRDALEKKRAALSSSDMKARIDLRWDLASWKHFYPLVPLRDELTLARLPDAEREQWQALWREVDALFARSLEMESK